MNECTCLDGTCDTCTANLYAIYIEQQLTALSERAGDIEHTLRHDVPTKPEVEYDITRALEDADLVTERDLENRLQDYVANDDLPDIEDLVTKDDLPDLDDYVTQDELSRTLEDHGEQFATNEEVERLTAEVARLTTLLNTRLTHRILTALKLR
jgi:hypothetical protein